MPAELFGPIAHDLRDRIIGGAFGPGARLPNRRELAARYGTTLATMQKVFDRLGKDGFIDSRVQRGTFVADRPPHLHHFAFVMHEHNWQSRYTRALRDEVEGRTARGPERFSVYLDIDGHASSEGQCRLMADIAASRLAGCILDMHPVMLGDNPLLADRTVPKVALVHESRIPDIPAVTNAIMAWYEMALDWLSRQGRKRVAWLGIPNVGHGQLRLLAEAAAARGLETSPAWSQAVDYRYAEWCANAIAAIFQRPPAVRPDALLISDDNLAEAAIAGLATAGLRIPRDLDVVCLNNFPLPLDVPSAVCQLGYSIAERIDACLDTLRALATSSPIPKTVEVFPRFACDVRNETNPTATERITP